MATQTDPGVEPRAPLSEERVLHAAVRLADEQGIESVTMRGLADVLGVEAMSLYYHVANKEALLDGMAEVVMQEVVDEASNAAAPQPEDDWKAAARMRILAARDVMLRHRWAPSIIESRTSITMASAFHAHGLIEIMRRGGLSYDLIHHAMHALGSRAFGFSQELFEPDDKDAGDDEANAMLEEMASQLPYMVEMLTEVAHDDPDSTIGWCDDQTEFEFAIDLILDGLDHLS